MEYHVKNNKLTKNRKPLLRVKLFNRLFCNSIQDSLLLNSQYATHQPVATIYRTIGHTHHSHYAISKSSNSTPLLIRLRIDNYVATYEKSD